MKNSSVALALQIAALFESHSEREWRLALDMLAKHGVDGGILEGLASIAKKKPVVGGRSASKKGRPDAKGLLSSLRETEPEKYEVLSEFERLLKNKQVLETHEGLRRFAESLSKDFIAGKSRADSINPLLRILLPKSTVEIEREISKVASFGVRGDTDGYLRLAKYLIKGE